MKNKLYKLAAEADSILREAVFQAQEELKLKNIPIVYSVKGKICWQTADNQIACKDPVRQKAENL